LRVEGSADWRPTANANTLHQRAEIIRRLREWFYQQNILEVETPQLSNGATTDPNIESFAFDGRHLRTSAEFHLKRLLAAGYPDVYELGKVFRVDESGRHHNPEFTMLEWYRLGIDHRELITEVVHLLRYLHNDTSLEVSCISYRDFWQQVAKIDLAHADTTQIVSFLESAGIDVPKPVQNNFDALQDLAMGTVLANSMPAGQYSCIYDYPSSQASLARIDKRDPEWQIASRFEIYYGSVELANGFHELTDAAEQLARFEADNRARKDNNQSARPIDHRFVAALDSGMPDCAGVAIGVDRLMMVLLDDVKALSEVVSFNWAIA